MSARGPYWIDNLLVPSLAWGVRGTVKFLNWGSQPGGRYGSFSVPWRGVVPVCPAYLLRSPEICAPLCTASATISLESTVWRASKVIAIPDTYSVIVWSIVWIAPGMIFEMNYLSINLCVVFMLVVKVDTFGFLFGSISVSSSYEFTIQ